MTPTPRRSTAANRRFTEELEKGVRALVRRDPVIRDLKRAAGIPTYLPRRDHFATLVTSILSQQISGSAAKTIIGRVEEKAGGLSDPRLIASLPDEILRGCGVSSQKLTYLRSLTEHIDDGRLELKRLSTLDDRTIIDELTAVKGIGVWTAQMFLMFSLGRLDVLPSDDLGVRNGIMKAYGLESPPKRNEIERLGEERGWAPYRSIASWYMWRALELPV